MTDRETMEELEPAGLTAGGLFAKCRQYLDNLRVEMDADSPREAEVIGATRTLTDILERFTILRSRLEEVEEERERWKKTARILREWREEMWEAANENLREARAARRRADRLEEAARDAGVAMYYEGVESERERSTLSRSDAKQLAEDAIAAALDSGEDEGETQTVDPRNTSSTSEVGVEPTRDQLLAAIDLFADDQLFFAREGEGGDPYPVLILNDTFGWAVADGERIPWGGVPALRDKIREEGWPAGVEWAAERRGEEPIEPVQEAMEEHDTPVHADEPEGDDPSVFCKCGHPTYCHVATGISDDGYRHGECRACDGCSEFRPTDEPVSGEGDREREVGRLMIEALDFMDEPTLQDFVERLARELTPDPSRMTENVGLVMGLDRFKQAVRKAKRLTHADARSSKTPDLEERTIAGSLRYLKRHAEKKRQYGIAAGIGDVLCRLSDSDGRAEDEDG